LKSNKNIQYDPNDKHAIQPDFNQGWRHLTAIPEVEKTEHATENPEIDGQFVMRRKGCRVIATIIGGRVH
jgi:hypothetical protein